MTLLCLLGQWWVLQFLCSVAAPTHGSPPYASGMDVRLRTWSPPPHWAEQLLQADQSSHSQCPAKQKVINMTCILSILHSCSHTWTNSWVTDLAFSVFSRAMLATMSWHRVRAASCPGLCTSAACDTALSPFRPISPPSINCLNIR